MDRISERGNSSILLSLAERVGNDNQPSKPSNLSNNVVPDTTLLCSDGFQPMNDGEFHFGCMNQSLREINIPSGFKAKDLKELDLKEYAVLQALIVDDGCFEDVEVLMLVGLKELERVVIGENSFVKSLYDAEKDGMDPNRHFYLRDCERVRELKIGCHSFQDYSICVISNVPSLEVIEMGDEGKDSGHFYYASLELKSDCDGMK